MDDYVYEEINIGGKRRNVSLGIFMKDRLHASKRVEIYNSDAFGRCLYLDGALQTTERDEFIYHEVLVHTALLRVKPENVLIIGGGDGGTLREVLKHKARGLKRVVMVEINGDVVEASKKHLPSFKLAESLQDPCVELIIQDGVEYLENIHSAQFDAILIDCSDPSDESIPLYSREFLECSAKPALKDNGVLAIQAGNVFIKEDFVRELRYELGRLWVNCQYHYVPIPSYPSGGIGFYFATNNPLTYVCDDYEVSKLDTKYFNRMTLISSRGIRPKSFNRNIRWENYDWYCKKFFDFNKNRTQAEARLMNKFFSLEGEPWCQDDQHSLMNFRQSFDKSRIYNHALTLMTLENVPRVESEIRDLLIERDIKLDIDLPVSGVTLLSMNNSLDVHFVASSADLEKYAPIFFKSKPPISFDEAKLSLHFYGKNQLVESSVSFADMSKDYCRSTSGIEEVNRVRVNTKSWKQKLNPYGQEAVELLEKQGIIFNRISWRHRDDFILYFDVR